MSDALSQRAVLNRNGRNTIPGAIREATDLKPGSRAIVTLGADGAGEIRLVESSRALGSLPVSTSSTRRR